MTRDDFKSTLRSLSAGQLPPPPDAHSIAMQLIMRDRRRTRALAWLSLTFWLIGGAGMGLLVIGLNRLVIYLRIMDRLQTDRPAGQPMSAEQWSRTTGWGTDILHHAMPYIAVGVVAMTLAAILTVLLVISSREATLNRINLSLAQIAQAMKRQGSEEI